MLALITVNDPGDFIDSDPNVTTLREAINIANADDGLDIIEFSTDPADGLDGGTITLTLGQIAFGKSLTIDASMLTDGITIDANDPTPNDHNGDGIRIFNITDPTFGSAPPVVTLVGLRLTGGDVTGSGGAIQSAAELIVLHCTIESNGATQFGGGIYSVTAAGTVRIADSTISGNTSGQFGGGIYAQANGAAVVEVENSTISANSSLYGGGISALGTGTSVVRITGSTISGNSSGTRGGGLFLNAAAGGTSSLLVEHSTVSGNTAGTVSATYGDGVQSIASGVFRLAA